MKKLTRLKVMLCACSLVLAGSIARAAYIIPALDMNGGGGSSGSSAYSLVSAIGQASPPGQSAGGSATSRSGVLFPLLAQGALLPGSTVYLQFAGTGSGLVTSDPTLLSCGSACAGAFNPFFPVTLTATADEYSLFSGWSGTACAGTGDCTLTLTGDATVTATFDLDTAHRVYVPATASFPTTLQQAYDTALPGATIMAWALEYNENLVCGVNKEITLSGGYNGGYTDNPGMTTLHGVLTIGLGTLVADRLAVR